METTLGSTAETRQNGADRPFPELRLAHWYAQLPEMKTPAWSERKRPGVCVEGSPFFRKRWQLPGRGWDGGGAHTGMIATSKQLPLCTLFLKSCKIRVPLPLCKGGNTKGSA